MIQKFKNVLIILTVFASAFVPTLAFSTAAASAAVGGSPDITGNLCAGTNLDATGGNTNCQSNSVDLSTLLSTIINYFSIFVGVVAVLMIIVGGLRYITSGGDSGKVSGAKTTIIYALVGLVVVALAQVIVHFVLNQASNIVTGG